MLDFSPMAIAHPCPCCGGDSDRALLGIFPVWLCQDDRACHCIWGAWSSLALWLADLMQPMDPIHPCWTLLRYKDGGTYLGALWVSLTHRGLGPPAGP